MIVERLAAPNRPQSGLLEGFLLSHIMFDTHVKPKVFRAMIGAGFKDMPESRELG